MILFDFCVRYLNKVVEDYKGRGSAERVCGQSVTHMTFRSGAKEEAGRLMSLVREDSLLNCRLAIIDGVRNSKMYINNGTTVLMD